MKGTWLRILGLLLFVAALAVGGGWWMMRGQGGSAAVVPEQPAKAAPVGADSIRPDVAEGARSAPLPEIDRDSLTLPGVIEPYESVPVSAKLTAAIASMHVRDGTMVSKGQLLCILESDELTRQIDSARLALIQSQETMLSAK